MANENVMGYWMKREGGGRCQQCGRPANRLYVIKDTEALKKLGIENKQFFCGRFCFERAVEEAKGENTEWKKKEDKDKNVKFW